MKKTDSCLIMVPLVFFFTVCFISAKSAKAQVSDKSIKIGVYDSRIVAFAYTRSESFRNYIAQLTPRYDSAAARNDTLMMKDQSSHAMSYQHLLHLMVFGSGSISDILRQVQDELSGLAKQEGVDIIVSKYELTYKKPDIETVDLTDKVAKLLKPTESIEDIFIDMKNIEPIPLQDLYMEIEMLDSYCERFGK